MADLKNIILQKMNFRPQYQLLAFSSKSCNKTYVSFSGGGSHVFMYVCMYA